MVGILHPFYLLFLLFFITHLLGGRNMEHSFEESVITEQKDQVSTMS